MAEIYPAEQFNCQPPENLEANDDAAKFINSPIPHFYELVHRAEPVTLSILNNINIATPHGLMFEEGRHLIAESYHNDSMVEIPLREVTSILANGVLAAPATASVEAPALLALGPWSWVYHHWLLEILPRLWVLDEFPEFSDIPIIVPGDMTGFQTDSLTALGIKEDQLLPFDGSNWQFDRLIVPSFLAPGGHSRRQIQWLRGNLFSSFDIEQNEAGKRRLYISRQDATRRRLLNEDDIENYLHKLGFETVLPGELSLKDQLLLFNEAEVICGTSGSGMTNHVFAPPQASVIEMQPDSYINRAHWFSSNACGQSYAFAIGSSESDHHDYHLPLEKLEQALKLIVHDGF
jgi:capsular polysaccharide biosynthesis protein